MLVEANRKKRQRQDRVQRR